MIGCFFSIILQVIVYKTNGYVKLFNLRNRQRKGQRQRNNKLGRPLQQQQFGQLLGNPHLMMSTHVAGVQSQYRDAKH